MPIARWLSVVLGAAAMMSCQGPRDIAPPLSVVFLVESDPGVGLSQAQVFVDGEPLGMTDSKGLVRGMIQGQPGQRLRVEHRCPKGHRPPSEPQFVRLRRFEAIDTSRPIALQITLACRPSQRLAAFIVRARNGPDLPVLLNGQSMTRTNRSGVAHFSIWGSVGTEYLVELDTKEHPGLRPRSPTHVVTLPDANEIFVINQSFDTYREPLRRAHRRARIRKIE